MKLLKVVTLSTFTLVLAACHSTKNTDQNLNAATDTSAKTYPLGQKSGLKGTDVNGGGMGGAAHMNTTRAPANQVYYFAFDQSGVKSSDMVAITAQANYLVRNRNAQVRLEGNADDRGSREYNVGLGYRRAKAVASVLTQQGVAANQIKIVSYGKEHPAVAGDNEHAWSLNRRVELIYVQK